MDSPQKPQEVKDHIIGGKENLIVDALGDHEYSSSPLKRQTPSTV